jgi:hypothetical protein
MAPLHAPVTAAAVADGDAKLADDGPHDREIFLMLGGVARQREGAATRGTCPRQRGLVLLVDAGRRGSMRLPAIRAAWLAAGTGGRAARRAARERRRLPMQGAARLVEVVLKAVDLLPQLIAGTSVAIAIPIGPLVLAPQSLNLALLSLEFGNQFIACGRPPSREHTPVMARLSKRYKYDFLDHAYG